MQASIFCIYTCYISLCSYSAVLLDARHKHIRIVRNNYDKYYITKLSEITINGFKIVKNPLNKKDLPLRNIQCHTCYSSNISIQKDNGKLIKGDDKITLICHDCEKFINLIMLTIKMKNISKFSIKSFKFIL